ncbi:hypothetical protein QCA50_016143 [Cerrena zonata]|uniref:Uncharacterized protein n=1 Tax=Cerrena zonata TaxID=2478898 RepID=A0AAW0FIE5_9APHY
MYQIPFGGEYRNGLFVPDSSDWDIRCKAAAYTGYIIDYNYSTPSEFIIIPDGVFSGCNVIALREGYKYSSGVITRCIASGADALVLGLTWYKTIDVVKESRRLHIKTGLSTLLIRNGSLQFLILLLLNATNVALNVLNIAAVTSASSFFFYINLSVSSMLVSRFLLDLRSVYLSGQGHDSLNSTSTIRFSDSIIGNIGAPLDTSVAFNAGDEHEIRENRIRYSNDPFSMMLELESMQESDESTTSETPAGTNVPPSRSDSEHQDHMRNNENVCIDP